MSILFHLLCFSLRNNQITDVGADVISGLLSQHQGLAVWWVNSLYQGLPFVSTIVSISLPMSLYYGVLKALKDSDLWLFYYIYVITIASI